MERCCIALGVTHVRRQKEHMKMISLLCALALVVPAGAQPRGADNRKESRVTDMTLDHAEALITASRAEAKAKGMKPLAIVVLDAGGHLVAAAREDGATMLRTDIASAKAWTAIGLGSSSRAFQEMAEARPNFAASLGSISAGRMAPAAGGVLIKSGAATIGAIGISGDTPDNDELAARAGLRD